MNHILPPFIETLKRICNFKIHREHGKSWKMNKNSIKEFEKWVSPKTKPLQKEIITIHTANDEVHAGINSLIHFGQVRSARIGVLPGF
jgi:hypothetical protein